MSDHSHALHPPEPEKFNAKHAGLLPTTCLLVGAVGLIGSLIGAFVSPTQFAYSWLFAFFYFFTLSAGALFWTILHHATDAEWSVVIRRQAENVASLLPWFFLIILPLIAFFPEVLWKWWDKLPGQDVLLDEKSGYLNQPFFYVRYVLYFVLLGGTALLLRRLSIAQDSDGKAKHSLLMRKVSIIGLPAFAVSLTFAAIDYLMCLDYHWFSTMWGVYIFAGAAGSSMSLLVLIITALQSRGYLKPVTLEHYHIMGKFMLAFTIF